MKASELRIGNFIYCGDEETKIYPEDFEMIDDCFFEWNPIPLTEEWLLKFGFEQLTPKYYVLNIDENISFAYYYTYSGGVWHFEFEGIPIKIEYINQLQNIYFALTGNELNIKK